MKKIFFLIILFFVGIVSIKAQETALSDGEFNTALDQLKNPFVADLPKPPAPAQPVVKPPEPSQEVPQPVAEPVAVQPEEEIITLPDLKLQGVVVGEEMGQAIIDDQLVPLQGTIKGARVVSVSKEGVGLLFKGKKFFLKTE
ncbi:MAG: hypothetical protein HQL14_01485 [Candidatus Omnitrophica bacterium]|nr:hypothetical protein [Candidatus Omnitrophota bacterium]